MRVLARYDSDIDRNGKIPPYARERVLAMLCDGLSPQEVAARYGVSTREVRRFAQKAGVVA